MPRVAIEDFNDDEVARVYLAARFAEAQLVEAELNNQNVDYAVEVESYLAGAVFWLSEYRGAAFYVPAAQADFCSGILQAAGLTAGLLEKQLQGTSMTTADIEYRRALPQDYPAIVQLNSANFIANLAEDEREDGFLSAVFTLEQTAAMAEDLGTTVAIVDGVLAGFLCAFRNDFDHGSPVVAKMIESYDRMRFEGKLLSSYNTYAYGPVCIGRAYRRQGLLRGLYEAQKHELAGRLEVGVALIARSNPHSMQAHVAGLGMIEVGDFEVNGNVFATVAFRVPARAG